MTLETEPTTRTARPTPRGEFGWRRLQVLAAYATIASLLIAMLITLKLVPILLSMAAPVAIGLVVAGRWPRAGAITLGVVSLAVLGSGGPFLVDALIHPESITDFLPLALFTLATLVGTIAAIPAYRETSPLEKSSGPSRGLALAAAVALAAAAVVSVISFVGVESQDANPGDLRLVAEDVEWDQAELSADSGTVSVHVTNRDSTRHTFTVDGLDVDLNVPPNTTQRISFEARPGTYRFFCRPHESAMKGTLEVG